MQCALIWLKGVALIDFNKEVSCVDVCSAAVAAYVVVTFDTLFCGVTCCHLLQRY